MRFSNQISITAAACAVIVLGNAASAFAGAFDPSYKGDPNSVHVAFDYNAPDMPWGAGELSTGATPYILSGQGPASIENEGDVNFVVPNLIDDLPIKHMRLQFFFLTAVDFNAIDVTVTGHDPLGAMVTEIGRGGDHSLRNYYIDFDITPNPDWEEIYFDGDPAGDIIAGNFVRLEVDTVSVPEPVSLSLIAIGSLVLTKRRRSCRR